MKKNIKLTLAYDGTRYLGWQKTFTGPSIESELQKALEQILQEKVSLQAASRTDAGVHAQGQVVNFFTQKEEIDFNLLKYRLNCLLPRDIAILEAAQETLDFHPTLHSIGKEYRYFICASSIQLPQYRFFSWHFYKPLDLESVRQAAKLLEGKHDFSAFCNVKKNSHYDTHVREVTQIAVEELPESRLLIRICGNHFLYKMVRNMVGTLLYIGCGKIKIESLPGILEKRNRVFAGVTAPAHGLTLYKVHYFGA